MENNTEKTGRTVPVKTPYIEVAQDADLQWHWCLWSGNGRAIAMNAISYERRNDCHQAVEITKQLFGDPRIKVVTQQDTKRKVRKKRGPNVNQQQARVPTTDAEGPPKIQDSSPQAEERKQLPAETPAAREEVTPIG